MMNTFESLLLGHLVADWLLQSDWMAVGKRRGWLALPGFAHYATYTAVILLILWRGSQGRNEVTSTLAIGVFVFLSHWLIDGTNLVYWWMRWAGQRDQALVRIMVDQTLHLLVLGAVAAWRMGKLAVV